MKRRTRNAIILALCLILIAGSVAFLRLRGGVGARPASDFDLPERVVAYRQDDPAWASDFLGDSVYTMKSSGCLVSSIASAFSMGGNTVTPGELNALFSDNAVYDNQGNMQWDALRALDGFQVKVYDRPSQAAIDECLADGHYPIVRVRMYGIGNIHYVLILGTEAGKYVCMDPLEDQLTTLSRYWNRIYAVRCVWKDR